MTDRLDDTNLIDPPRGDGETPCRHCKQPLYDHIHKYFDADLRDTGTAEWYDFCDETEEREFEPRDLDEERESARLHERGL